MMLIGSMVWAWVIGSLCGILATLNPLGLAFQNLMDELNLFMRDNNFMSGGVGVRAVSVRQKYYWGSQQYDKLKGKMSAQLRGERT